MSVFKGNTGKVMEAGKCIGELSHWTMTTTAADLDVSAFNCSGSVGWGSHTTGLLHWTGTASGFFDASDEGQKDLWNATTGNAPVDLYLYLDPDNYFWGTAGITSVAIDDAIAGVVTVTFNFAGQSELHKVPA